ncbi:hypothetical protein [Paraburkholderia sp. J11-2]|uniref:hypothetical protein n=1 Tax=Paraburkholderia sp. J11-2 TaxID=2805431 RepID=UPI002AB7A366|nr:hypothetical protein [Paraburkholderia sp. J11-2]
MNASQTGVSAALSAYCALLNSGTLVFLSGTQPATPETALSGNTTLCTATYSSTAFGTPSFSSPNMQATGSFTAGSYTPTAAGTSTFCRAYESNGTTVIADLTVGSNWIASQAAVLGQYCLSSGNTYKVTTAGTSSTTAPSGTTTFSDGTVTWTYVGAGQLFDVLISNPAIQLAVPVSCSQTMKMPAV